MTRLLLIRFRLRLFKCKIGAVMLLFSLDKLNRITFSLFLFSLFLFLIVRFYITDLWMLRRLVNLVICGMCLVSLEFPFQLRAMQLLLKTLPMCNRQERVWEKIINLEDKVNWDIVLMTNLYFLYTVRTRNSILLVTV